MLISQNCGQKLRNEFPIQPTGFFLNHGKLPWNYDLADASWKSISDPLTIPNTLPFISMGKRVNFSDFNQLSD